jgi:hypothetical protein
MTTKVRKIEVDVETAERLEARAAARGVSVAQLVSELAFHDTGSAHSPWSPGAFEEDARRLEEFDRTRMGVPWDEIKSWMETCGTAAERPPPAPRKL